MSRGKFLFHDNFFPANFNDFVIPAKLQFRGAVRRDPDFYSAIKQERPALYAASAARQARFAGNERCLSINSTRAEL